MSLPGATRSEITKQFSTAIWWILAIVLFVYIASSTGGIAAVFGATASGALSGEAAMPIPTDAALMLYSFATSLGYVFALLIGTLMVTGEFRHQTLTPTFLALPRRGRALLAKVLVGVLIGLIYGVIAIVSAVGPAAGVLAAFGEETALGEADTWAMIGRMLLALVIWTILGVGLGALVRNQVAAVVGVLAFTQFVEPIVRLAASYIDGIRGVVNYLPGAAGDALVGTSFFELAMAPGAEPLRWWVGGIVLAVYAAVLLLLGYLFSWRRDVS